jgi:hypothetical protein
LAAMYDSTQSSQRHLGSTVIWLLPAAAVQTFCTETARLFSTQWATISSTPTEDSIHVVQGLKGTCWTAIASLEEV